MNQTKTNQVKIIKYADQILKRLGFMGFYPTQPLADQPDQANANANANSLDPLKVTNEDVIGALERRLEDIHELSYIYERKALAALDHSSREEAMKWFDKQSRATLQAAKICEQIEKRRQKQDGGN